MENSWLGPAWEALHPRRRRQRRRSETKLTETIPRLEHQPTEGPP